jgi:hypothetical protein
MNFIFEIDSLQHASPATVSRCGIVFLDQKILGWEVIINSYFMKQFPANIIKYKVSVSILGLYREESGVLFKFDHGFHPGEPLVPDEEQRKLVLPDLRGLFRLLPRPFQRRRCK